MTVLRESPATAYDVDAPPPRHLQLEVMSACNLRCRMCLVSYRPGRNRHDGAMSWETFTSLVDSVPDLERVTLQGLGEPLLAPRLVDMVRYVKARGARVGFNSNGMLLSRRRSAELVDAGLDWLHVSCDAATEETFRAVRHHVSLETVGRNVRALVEAREAAGSELPWIRVVAVAMRRTLPELPDLVRLVRSWGVDELRVQNLSHTFDDTDPSGAYAGIREFVADEALLDDGSDRDETLRIFAEARRVAEDIGVRLRLPDLGPVVDVRDGDLGPGCSMPWHMSYVTSDGVVQPCCMVMGDDRVSLGSVVDLPLPQVLAGDRGREFRAALLSDEPPTVCRGCSVLRGRF